MNKLATFRMFPAYRHFRVYKADDISEEGSWHGVTEQTLAQGFSARPGSLNFYTLGDCLSITIEVWVAEPSTEIRLRPETVRAILLPFAIDREGIKIPSDIAGLVDKPVLMPEGNYALLFELKSRDDVEYLNSPLYQHNVEGGFTQEFCHLTFYPRADAVQPEILRLDAESGSPDDIEGYSPLNPTYPLLMEIGLA